jgi:hypothetical protein
MKRACGLPTVRKYKRMRLGDKMARRALLDSGYGKSGGQICTRRWTCCARLSTSTHTSAWSVYHFPSSQLDSSCCRALSDVYEVSDQRWSDGLFIRGSFHLPLLPFSKHLTHSVARTQNSPASSRDQSATSTPKPHTITKPCAATSTSLR